MRLLLRAFEIAVVVTVVTELFFYALRRYELAGSGDARGLRRGALNVFGSFLAQCGAILFAQLGHLGSPFWPFPLRRPAATPPVILLHGHAGSRTALVWLAWRLRRDGFENVIGVRHRPLGADAYGKAKALAATIERVLLETGAVQVDVVAHSLGGLVARAYIREYGGAARVRRLVTLGTPHQGTRVAAFALDAAARSLLPGSRLLQDLGREDPVPTILPVTSIFSTFDARILPCRSAFYPGAANVEVDAIGHDAMLFSPKISRLVVEALADVPALRRSSNS
ncbi:MAG: lipase family alpha/beta hydrolase [Candidatus Binatia bacterium]